MNIKKYIWPLLGFILMCVALHVLYKEFFDPQSAIVHLSFQEFLKRLKALSYKHWIKACLFSLIAYLALAGYDYIALQYLQKKISFLFITLCSFTTYALSHNLGASVFSGAAIRYRAYSLKGLSTPQIIFLVSFCSFTFALGTLLLTGIVLLIHPEILNALQPTIENIINHKISTHSLTLIAKITGIFCIIFILSYLLGAIFF